MLARAYAAGTVLNALATFRGSAFAISLETRVKVEVEDGVGDVEVFSNGERIESPVATRIMGMLGLHGVVEVRSEIPRGSGLGSSSAFVNALLCSLLKYRGEELDAYRILSANARISLESGISYTGAFDDASASLLGGFVVSDNRKLKLYRWDRNGGNAIVLLPRFGRGKIDWGRIRSEGDAMLKVLPKLLEGRYCDVMVENTRFYCRLIGYPIEIAEKAWNIGVCCGLSGNGPCFVAFGSRNDLAELGVMWEEYGSVIETRIPKEPAEKLKIGKDLFI